MERTIGTISGGVLGLAISLLGHGFGQDSDMVFTGARLPSHLIDIVKRGSTVRDLQLASMMTPCPMLTASCITSPLILTPNRGLEGLVRFSHASSCCKSGYKYPMVGWQCCPPDELAGQRKLMLLCRSGCVCGGFHSRHRGMGAVS